MADSQVVPAPTALNPVQTLYEITRAYFLARCLQVVADAGVADVLGDEGASAFELANATGLHPGALGRILRLLSAHNIFERRDGGFGHTPASRLLRSDDPHSVRPLVRIFGLPAFWKCAELLDRSLKTGQPVADQVIPGGFWRYFAENPLESRLFDEAMTAKSQAQITGALVAYDFSRFGVIGDIGGGRGHLLRAILAASPNASGILFDLPHVIEQASVTAGDRLTFQCGDFFTDELPVCDAYILMEVIHDWNDEESVRILKAVRQAAPDHSKLLLIEAIVTEDENPCSTKTLDIVMLVLVGGSQRTYAEYGTLLAKAGFRLDRAIDIGGTYSILESSVA